MKSLPLALIAAMDEQGLIGAGRELPWHSSLDLAHFHEVSTGAVLLVGRTTFEGMTAMGVDWNKWHSVVVLSTRIADGTAPPGVRWRKAFPAALSLVNRIAARSRRLPLVAGGASVYRQALPYVAEAWISRIEGRFCGDVYMPSDWSDGLRCQAQRRHVDGDLGVTFQYWVRHDLPASAFKAPTRCIHVL